MLQLKLAEAYVDLVWNTKQFDSQMKVVQGKVATVAKNATVTLQFRSRGLDQIIAKLHQIHKLGNVNLAMPNFANVLSQLNAINAHLMRMQRLAQNINVPGRLPGIPGPRTSPSGGGFRARGGAFLSGFTMGADLPFASSPEMLVGQLAGRSMMGSAQTAIRLESQMAELRRIGGFDASQGAGFKQAMFRTGTKTPGSSIDELMEIAQIGARAGVGAGGKIGDLETFTQSMAKVKLAVSDMPIEQLAGRMQQVMNVFGLGAERVEGFGSALTAMDNVSVASAKDILDITARLSGTAKQIDLTLPQILALSSVLKDVGLSNEVAGSSFSQIFRLMAAKSGEFAAKIKVDAQKFKAAINENPMEALRMLMGRLRELSANTEGQEFLSSLGLRGVRVTAALQQLESKFDDVAVRAQKASEETGTLEALTAAVELKGNTTEASLTKMMNAAVELGDALGSNLVPHIKSVTDELTRMAVAARGGKAVEAAGEASSKVLAKGTDSVFGILKKILPGGFLLPDLPGGKGPTELTRKALLGAGVPEPELEPNAAEGNPDLGGLKALPAQNKSPLTQAKEAAKKAADVRDAAQKRRDFLSEQRMQQNARLAALNAELKQAEQVHDVDMERADARVRAGGVRGPSGLTADERRRSLEFRRLRNARDTIQRDLDMTMPEMHDLAKKIPGLEANAKKAADVVAKIESKKTNGVAGSAPGFRAQMGMFNAMNVHGLAMGGGMHGLVGSMMPFGGNTEMAMLGLLDLKGKAAHTPAAKARDVNLDRLKAIQQGRDTLTELDIRQASILNKAEAEAKAKGFSVKDMLKEPSKRKELMQPDEAKFRQRNLAALADVGHQRRAIEAGIAGLENKPQKQAQIFSSGLEFVRQAQQNELNKSSKNEVEKEIAKNTKNIETKIQKFLDLIGKGKGAAVGAATL